MGLEPEDEEIEKTEEEVLKIDSETSYFTLDQYRALDKRITDAHYRMKEQQTVIERLDKTTGAMIGEVREKRGVKKGIASDVQ